MDTKKTGIYKGQSNRLGSGGRAAQLADAGVPGGVIGGIARTKQAAPGQKNYHPGKPAAPKATAAKAAPFGGKQAAPFGKPAAPKAATKAAPKAMPKGSKGK